jgi:hypothetical protein
MLCEVCKPVKLDLIETLYVFIIHDAICHGPVQFHVFIRHFRYLLSNLFEAALSYEGEPP